MALPPWPVTFPGLRGCTVPWQAEKQEIEGLREQVSAAKAALQREQDLVEKIKREAEAASAGSQRQVRECRGRQRGIAGTDVRVRKPPAQGCSEVQG